MPIAQMIPVLIAGAVGGILASFGPATVAAVIALPIVGAQAMVQHAKIISIEARLFKMDKPVADYTKYESVFSERDVEWLRLEKDRLVAYDELGHYRELAVKWGLAAIPIIGVFAAISSEFRSQPRPCADCGTHTWNHLSMVNHHLFDLAHPELVAQRESQ